MHVKDAPALLFSDARQQPRAKARAVAADGHLAVEVAPALRSRRVPFPRRLRLDSAPQEARAPMPADCSAPFRAPGQTVGPGRGHHSEDHLGPNVAGLRLAVVPEIDELLPSLSPAQIRP